MIILSNSVLDVFKNAKLLLSTFNKVAQDLLGVKNIILQTFVDIDYRPNDIELKLLQLLQDLALFLHFLFCLVFFRL